MKLSLPLSLCLPWCSAMAAATTGNYAPISSSSSVLFSTKLGSCHKHHLGLYFDHIKRCNRGKDHRCDFIPFVVDNITLGFIHPRFLQYLLDFPTVFSVIQPLARDRPIEDIAKLCIDSFVTLHHDLKTKDDRTQCINESLKVLNQKGLIRGWRNEMYPVVDMFGNAPIFSLERAAVPFFGTKAYGVHINGYITKPDGERNLWVAKRSMSKQTYPGMLDHLVAGGQAEGLTCKDNVIKECDEEASIPRAIAEKAVPVGAVSYEDIDGERFKRDVLFCYDLELPHDFQPQNRDGEVESFLLLPIWEVQNILQTTCLYKPNCALVVIDFLFRHGYITPDEDGYLHLLQSLRMGECL